MQHPEFTDRPPQEHPAHRPDVSVVVIGRNEGERLERCLHSVHAADWEGLTYELIYVDSGSTDDSLAIAQRCHAQTLHIASAQPSAAAGRNKGWQTARAPAVLFLDGDTQLQQGFVRKAWKALYRDQYAAVWGHRREIAPEQSIYTAVLDLDWVYAPGETPFCGGDALFSREALAEVQGFDERLTAGEEPDLCRRLRALEWRILHIDAPMTSHDLAITSLRQYWRRAMRAGQAYAQVAHRYHTTPDPLWQEESRRNWVHGSLVAALPWTAVASLSLAPWGTAVLACATLGLLARSTWRCRWKGGGWRLSLLYAIHSHIQQLPILCGQLRYHWQAQRGHQPGLTEYKTTSSRR